MNELVPLQSLVMKLHTRGLRTPMGIKNQGTRGTRGARTAVETNTSRNYHSRDSTCIIVISAQNIFKHKANYVYYDYVLS